MAGYKSDEEYSEIGDKGEIGFIDFEDDRSVCSYSPDDEGTVTVSVPFPFVGQKPQSVTVDEVTGHSITIRNTTTEPVDLWSVQIYASNPEESFTLSLMEPSTKGFVGFSMLEDRVLQPLKTLKIWLSCKPKDIGLHTCIVHFDVGDDKIERVVFLLAEDNVSKALASKKPYQRARRQNQFTVDKYVNGVRPARATNRSYRHRLPFYEIPKDIREILELKQVPEAICDGLSRKNYVPFFRTLLVMEELKLEEDIRAYDMEKATLTRRGRQYLTLEVLGLAERRPSLVHGDSVFARFATENVDESLVYEGCIHRVEADQVFLRFADEFHHNHSDNNFYNIRFMYNRVNIRRLYQAVEAAENLPGDFLFLSDTVVNRKRQITPNLMVPISSKLNEEQLNAVEMILGCRGGAPYMINGPPGTGKTMTLVEVILQIYRGRQGSKVLICAASNCAADHILEKILNEKDVHVRENEIFRLNASSRSYEDVKQEYLKYCFCEESVFRCPPLQALWRYRIIVTTYMSASLLYSEGVRRGQFSHIILDEAGQASEPETMVPISHLCDNNTVVVLAGDPKQLGPVVFSPDANRHGLGDSYLERLFECDLYSEGDPSYVTTLRRNYRCHPDILYLPSKLFYNDELIACREEPESAPWVDLLPNKEFPILFTGVQAYDEREGGNPSWFNRTEASMVVKLIKKLIAREVSEDDIGVITPYRQQVAKIKAALENDDILDVKIGSVEQFQGQERDVIIISTVRSTIKHEEFDKVHCLGFLSNPKRFNVAITRAKSLLVIIGNPHIICKDPYWEQLLWRCVENNSYEGCSLPERQYYNHEIPGAAENCKESSWDVDIPNVPPGDGQGCSWDEYIPEPAPGNGKWDEDVPNAPPVDGQGCSWDEYIPEPVPENGKWSSWDEDVPNAPPADGQGSSWDEYIPEPVPENGKWSSWDEDVPNGPPADGQGCSWDESIPESVPDHGQGYAQKEDYPKPVKDEDEWSDGWK